MSRRHRARMGDAGGSGATLPWEVTLNPEGVATVSQPGTVFWYTAKSISLVAVLCALAYRIGSRMTRRG